MRKIVRVIPLVVACSALLSTQPVKAQKNPSVQPVPNVTPTENSIKDAPGFPGKGKKEDWQKATVLFNEGIDLAKAKKYPEAIKKYNAAIAKYAFDPVMYANLGFALERNSDPKAGEAACRKGVALDKEFGGAWENLGNCLYDQGKLTESRDAFEGALKCELKLTKRNELLKVVDILNDKIKKGTK
jgi:tetratricopeptide (TPR) repeat protein